MLVILMVSLMLVNLNTDHADTEADLCIRLMSLCCNLRKKSTISKRTSNQRYFNKDKFSGGNFFNFAMTSKIWLKICVLM